MCPGGAPHPPTLGTLHLPLSDFWSPIRAHLPRSALGMPAALLGLAAGFVTARVVTAGYYRLCFAQALAIKEILVAKARN